MRRKTIAMALVGAVLGSSVVALDRQLVPTTVGGGGSVTSFDGETTTTLHGIIGQSDAGVLSGEGRDLQGGMLGRVPIRVGFASAISDCLETDASTTLTLKLDRPASEEVTVHYATSNASAEAPGDYSSDSGVVTFPEGTIEQEVAISLADDETTETLESFTVNLSGPAYAKLATSSHTVNIYDFEEGPARLVTHLLTADPCASSITVAIVLENNRDFIGGYNFSVVYESSLGEPTVTVGTFPGSFAKGEEEEVDEDWRALRLSSFSATNTSFRSGVLATLTFPVLEPESSPTVALMDFTSDRVIDLEAAVLEVGYDSSETQPIPCGTYHLADLPEYPVLPEPSEPPSPPEMLLAECPPVPECSPEAPCSLEDDVQDEWSITPSEEVCGPNGIKDWKEGSDPTFADMDSDGTRTLLDVLILAHRVLDETPTSNGDILMDGVLDDNDVASFFEWSITEGIEPIPWAGTGDGLLSEVMFMVPNGTEGDYNRSGVFNFWEDQYIEFFNAASTSYCLNGSKIEIVEDGIVQETITVSGGSVFVPPNGYLAIFGGGTDWIPTGQNSIAWCDGRIAGGLKPGQTLRFVPKFGENEELYLDPATSYGESVNHD